MARDRDAAVLGEIAVGVAAEAADLDLADLAGAQRCAIGADNREIMIRERTADGAETPLFARDGGDPAGLARSVALREGNAEVAFEASPFLDRQRRRTRRDEAERFQRWSRHAFAVEQDVDGGRIAGRDGHSMFVQVPEETAGRELLRHHQRGAAVDRNERAQKLRRGPVERAEVIDPVVGRDAESIGGRIDIRQMLAIGQHDALRSRTGAGREQDHRVVIGPGVGVRGGCLRASDGAEERIVRGGVPVAEPERGPGQGGEQVIKVEPVLMEHKLRLQTREDVVELIAVHLDMYGADRRAIGHDAEISQEVLDRVVRQERDAVVATDPAISQDRCDAAGRSRAIRVIAQRAVVIGAYEPRLRRRARRRAVDPVSQIIRAGLHGNL